MINKETLKPQTYTIEATQTCGNCSGETVALKDDAGDWVQKKDMDAYISDLLRQKTDHGKEPIDRLEQLQSSVIELNKAIESQAKVLARLITMIDDQRQTLTYINNKVGRL